MVRLLKGIGIFAALVVVGVISAFAVVALLLRQEEVRVPDLREQDIVNVIEMVSQQGLLLKVDRREPHPTLPRDMVISQTPPAGVGIKKGRQVHVVISQGPSETQAVKVVGENYRRADIMIRQAGFAPGPVSRVPSDRVERDIVIAQAPEAGSQLDKGGAISLLISTGKRSHQFIMPRLIGKRAEEAVALVNRMGLQHRLITKTTSSQTPGLDRIITQQKPSAGAPVSPDAMVDLVLGREVSQAARAAQGMAGGGGDERSRQ